MTEIQTLTPGQEVIKKVLEKKGFSPEQFQSLLSVGNVAEPGDLGNVLNLELISVGFNPRQVNQLRQYFSRTNLPKLSQ